MNLPAEHVLAPLFRPDDAEPREPLVTFLDDRGRAAERRTRAELAERAAGTAAYLTESCGLVPGDVALLVYPPGMALVEAYAACLLAGVVAAPVYPPNPLRPEADLERIRSIAARVKIRAILTTTAYRAAARLGQARGFVTGGDARWPRVPWLVTDGRSHPSPARFVPPAVGADTVAVLQFTSGSTAAPKGVRLTHGNLRHQLAFNRERLGAGPDAVAVMWVPPYHDLGLISFVTASLAGNGRLVAMSPQSFLADPGGWLDAIHRFRGTHTASPNFGFDLVVRKTTPAQRRRWDLSCLKVVMSAAEPIVPETVDRFYDAFAASGLSRDTFCPAYGLAEHTVGVTMGPGRAARVRVDRVALQRDHHARIDASAGDLELMSCGTPSHGIALRVVDPSTGVALGDRRVGELWVRSPSVAAGYEASPDATSETFGGRLAGDDGRWLRTGDLGFVHGGELYVTGRLKDLVIVRGRNIHPEDVEQVVRGAHPAIRPGGVVAFAAGGGATEDLTIWTEVRDEALADDVLSAVTESVASAFGVRPVVAVVAPGTVRKTTSGKVRRAACREAWEAGDLPVLARTARREPRASAEAAIPLRVALEEAPPEARVRTLAQGILAIAASRVDVPSLDDIDPEMTLSELGVDSVSAVELRSALQAELGVDVPAGLFMEAASVDELSGRLLALLGYDHVRPPRPAPRSARMPWRRDPGRTFAPARTRIAVVGGGIGGLVAALELARQGFTRIVLHEASPVPGGKICTAWAGQTPIELGQMYLLDSFRVLVELANDLGLEMALLPRELRFWDDAYGLEPGPAHGPGLAYAARVLAAAKVPAEAELPFPTLLDVPDEPFRAFLQRNGLWPVHPAFETIWHGMGYGDGLDAPLSYALAYLQIYVPSRRIARLTKGNQELCFALARELREGWGVDVRLGCPVERVEPVGDGVVLHGASGTERFDEVILAVPPAAARKMLPAGPRADLLERFVTRRFWVGGVRTAALPANSAVYRPGSVGEVGVPLAYQSSTAQDGWHTAGAYLDAGPGTAAVDASSAIAAIGAQVRRLGGEVTIGEHRAWDYFPHPREDAVGTLRALEALQGGDRVWMTGSFLSFESTEHVARHARHLVRTCFSGEEA